MATLKTFKAAYDDFVVHLLELMGQRPEQRERYSVLLGCDYENGLLLASNMRCLMFMKAPDKLSVMDFKARYKVTDIVSHIEYRLAIKYPFGGKADRVLTADNLRTAIQKSMRLPREHYNPTVMLPDGNCYNSHYLNTALTFFAEDCIEARTIPFNEEGVDGGDILMLRNQDKDAFFYIRPDRNVEDSDMVRYVEGVTKEELSGTLFDLL